VASFIIGLSTLPRDDQILLLAQLNSITGWNALSEGVHKGVYKAKKFVLGVSGKLASRFGADDFSRQINRLDRNTEWNTEQLAEKINSQVQSLQKKNSSDLWLGIRARMAEIAGIKHDASDMMIADSIITKTASQLKVDLSNYHDSETREEQVFKACIEEQVKKLQETISKMSTKQQEEYEEILRQELEKLSHADQEAIRKATGLSDLSGQALLNFLKTTSGVVIAQMLVGATGFGAFLFLTTSIHALALLLGIGLSFGVYTAATSALAFLLSGPFFFLVAGLAGGFLYYRTSEQLRGQLAKILIVTGRAHALQC
jgi:hypothetical protein